MELTLLGGAFLAGVLSFLSPCVLPLLPTFSLILAKNSRQDGREAQRLYVNTAAFLAGFIVVFVLLGATASLLGAWLSPIRRSCGRARRCSSYSWDSS